jgi:quinone-modifying oxidoreductase subunit QmoC
VNAADTPSGAGPGLAEAPKTTPERLEPDLDFIRAMRDQTGGTFKKCFQCGTCSSTCDVSPEANPFPRKEMSWAAWGLKDRLLTDPDVWLCHQCNDCTLMCPRGGRPGDVLAAVRRECIMHYSVPGALARWANRPAYFPLLLGIPAVLLCVALLVRDPLGAMLGFAPDPVGKISFSYSSMLPHWLVNLLFGVICVVVALAVAVTIARFWSGLKSGAPPERLADPARGVFASFLTVLKSAFLHRDFALCTKSKPRFLSHVLVVFGFIGLTAVTLWVITSRMNPLIGDTFVYPFAFWNPWKVLANLGGIAVVAGCVMMIWERIRDPENFGSSTWFDWSLVSLIFLVATSGLLTEVLHYTRYEPHRHASYFIHLVFVAALFLYLPYSKLAHLVYRTTAMVFAEHTGRRAEKESAS